ncbi:bifunctional riboflavin kinase/FAD synthetase [Pelosinus sp. sgz500959]|uniref:bifunctional riboflavin kinase/FAD synthetase n=1 Tax=Pelosinus sp. sgz500959 TaxID=3242472 RepID=UPI00366EF79A
MEIIKEITNLTEKFPRMTIALGTFDGIHLGHQKIISRAVELAKEINGTSVVFTFSTHPLAVVAPKRCPLQLVTQDDKAELIEKLGVDVLLTIPFTPEFLKYSAEQFIDLALKNLDPKHIVIGPNYFFGYKRSGTPELLQQAGIQHGFKVEIHPIVYVDDVIVSSTLIRKLIGNGHVDQAAHLLGRPVKVNGIVIHGAKRGRKMGYPTVNLEIPNHLILPADGVYAVSLTIKNIQYNGIANIGNNPTFQGTDRRLEVHILNFSGDLYGQSITVCFLKHIRGQVTFADAEGLKSQIYHDIKAAEVYYAAASLK